MAKKLHPVMQAKAAAVKQAHAHLTKTVPGFASRHPHERVKAVHAHLKKTGC